MLVLDKLVVLVVEVEAVQVSLLVLEQQGRVMLVELELVLVKVVLVAEVVVKVLLAKIVQLLLVVMVVRV